MRHFISELVTSELTVEAVNSALEKLKNVNEGKANPHIDEFTVIDFEGKKLVTDRPLLFNKLHKFILKNFNIVAGPDFPQNEFLLKFKHVSHIRINNFFLECNKRTSGIYLDRFLKVEVARSSIFHQTEYGIYASEVGHNHELEVRNCNICEFQFMDKDREDLPDFQKVENRTSIGIFLGQADNVVADNNINLCKVGIKVGMRANRIQGNHITGGGSKGNELIDGIVIDKHIKSAALIVNNYIDNCRLLINIDDQEINKINYLTVTDNLFYKGHNHPTSGGEFNHIVVKPLKPNSVLQNILISNNQFYNQDQNLEGDQQRVIIPVYIDESKGTIDSKQVVNAHMLHNTFTNSAVVSVVPKGTSLSMQINPSDEARTEFEADFSENIAWGEIQSIQVIGLNEEYTVENLANKVKLKTSNPVKTGFEVRVNVNTSDSNQNLIVL